MKIKNAEIYIFALVSVVFCLYNIKNLDMTTILNDEFGYWGNAELLVGNNWQPLLSETPFYSCGYSLFLVPLIRLIDNPGILYRSAIILNTALVFISSIIIYKMTYELCGLSSKIERVVITFLSVFNPTILFHAQVAWAECLISTLYVILIFYLCKFEKTLCVKYAIFSLLTAFALVLTHKRSVPIVMLLIMALIILALLKRRYKLIFIFISFIIVGYFLTSRINDFQLGVMYANSEASSLNNISISSGSITYISKLKSDFVLFLSSLIGKIYAASVSTACIGLTTIIILIREVIKKQSKEHRVTILFILSSAIVMIGLTSLQMMGSGRKDMPTYSRYYDYTIIPLVMIGLAKLLRNKMKKTYILSVIITIAMTPFVYLITSRAAGFYNVPCNVYMGGFFHFVKNNELYAFHLLVKVTVILAVLFSILLFKNYSTRIKAIVFFLIIFINFRISFYANQWLDFHRDSIRNNIMDIAENIQTNNNAKIFFVKEEDQSDYCVEPKYLQFIIPNRTIYVIDEYKLNSLDSGSFILTNFSSSIEIDINAYNEVCSSKTLILYVKE